MKKLIPLALLLFVAACVTYSSNYKVIRNFEGPYSAQLIQEHMTTPEGKEVIVPRIRYFVNSKEYRAYFPPDMLPAMDFIKNSTSPDSVFLCWWDYGHVIRGYTGIEVIVDSPSASIKNTVSGGYIGELSSEEKIKDVATALATTSEETLKTIMNKYKAKYLYIHKSDGAKSWVIFQTAGLDPGNYITYLSTGDLETTDLGAQTILFRALTNREINSLKVVYDDGVSKILELVE